MFVANKATAQIRTHFLSHVLNQTTTVQSYSQRMTMVLHTRENFVHYLSVSSIPQKR